MPIPDADKIHIEASVVGLMAAGGSSAVDVVNVFHYRRTTFVAVFNKVSFEAAFHTKILTPLLAMLNARYTHNLTRVRILDDPTDPYLDTTHTGVGAIAGDSLPSVATAYMAIRTALRGKRYRGAKQFGPMSESDTTTNGDVFNAACLTRLGTMANALDDSITDGDGNVYNPCIFSRFLSTFPPNPVNVVSNDITQVLVRKTIGRLKRRAVKSVY